MIPYLKGQWLTYKQERRGQFHFDYTLKNCGHIKCNDMYVVIDQITRKTDVKFKEFHLLHCRKNRKCCFIFNGGWLKDLSLLFILLSRFYCCLWCHYTIANRYVYFIELNIFTLKNNFVIFEVENLEYFFEWQKTFF